MKKHLLRILLTSLLAASMVLPLFACTTTNPGTDTLPDTQSDTTIPDTDNSESEDETEVEIETEEPVVPVDPAAFGEADITYVCDDDSILSTYKNRTVEDYKGICAYYKQAGYTVYSSIDMDGNPATTLTKGAALAHVYYHPHNGELNIVLSDTAADTLPPQTPAVTDGEYECTITQIKDTQNFIGMGYIIQLKDGSYVIYDGGFANQASSIIGFLNKHNRGEDKPIVRAWILTHSHNDHYPAFEQIANKKSWRKQFVLENVIYSPLNEDVYTLTVDEEFYFANKLRDDAALFGANVIFAHTGMEFTFCNLDLEVLYTPESAYKYTTDKGNFNDTSLITRLHADDYSAIFLGDVSRQGTAFVMDAYGDYLKSDVCQMSHHGVEGDYILDLYDTIKPQIMFYPASVSLFSSTDAQYNPQVHYALFERDYMKEILVHGFDQFTRAWGTTFDADAKLSIPGYTVSAPIIGSDISVQNGTGTREALSISDWLAYRIRVNGEITGFSFDIPTWTTTGSDCTLAVYAWNTDVATTMASEPLASKRIEDLIDNSTNRMNFPTPLPGGEYLFAIQDVTGTVGVYCNQGSTGGAGILYTPNGESTDQPSLKIAFNAPPASPFGTGDAILSTDKTTYTEGEAIMVTAGGYNKDWVGIAKKGETTPIRWWYLTPVADGVHAPNGHAFNAAKLPSNGNGDGKLPAGDYTLYLVANDGKIADGEILSALDITITPAEGQAPADTALTPSIHLSFDGNTADAENRVSVQEHGAISYTEGKNGQAAVLGSAYVSIPNFITSEDSFTVSVWAKISGLSGDPTIFSTKNWAGGSNIGFALGITGANLHANLGDGNRRTDSKPTLDGVDISGWNHYTLVFDRDAREMRVSVNFGAFTVSTIPNELVNAPYLGEGALFVGQDATGAYGHGSMTCVMDDLMVFDRALTQAELAQLAK